MSYGEWVDGPKLNGMPQLFLLNSERNPCLKIILPPQLANDGIKGFATMRKLYIIIILSVVVLLVWARFEMAVTGLLTI
mgnify:CR=1 FL=1